MHPLHKLIAARVYLLSIVETLLATACYLAAVFRYQLDAGIYLLYEGGVQHLALVALTFLIGSYLLDFYKQIRVRSRLVLVLELCQLIGVIFIMQAAAAFINTNLALSLEIIIAGSALTLIVLIAWRLFVRPVVWNAIGAQRILFIGVSQAVSRLALAFDEQPELGMEVTGYIGPDGFEHRASVLGSYREISAIVTRIEPHRVIVAADGLRDKSVLKTLFDMRSTGMAVESDADVYEAVFGRIYSRGIDPYTVIFRNELSARPGRVALQSIYTNLLSLAAVVAALPLMAAVAIVIRLSRKGPVLVRHACTGLHGIPFNRYRFDCETHGATAVNRFLMRFRLEALPQILNIVRGEMALIGPRAERVEFSETLDDLIPFYRQKYSVKPGAMGWSQLHCDVAPTEDTLGRIEYDLYYIKHISLVLDAYIVLRALKWALSDRSSRETAGSLRNVSEEIKSL
jgi:lipopolysaccharide/colanic/teichoic acid biosynthesis glycosyltransferase